MKTGYIRFLTKHKKKDMFKILIAGMIVAYASWTLHQEGSITFETFFDIPTLLSIFIIYIGNILIDSISYYQEDMKKVTSDKKSIENRYNNAKLAILTTQDNTDYSLPIVEIANYSQLKNKSFNVSHNNVEFRLPPYINTNIDELFSYHSSSIRYNQILLRLDNVNIENDSINFETSRTTFYKSLLSNRSIDVPLHNSTIREFYEPGPFISELKESVFSNHLGVNVVIETTDNKILWVKRSNNMSINKNKLGLGVSASIKPKYFENPLNNITISDIEKSICMEIYDELGVDSAIMMEEFSLEKNLISVFRELYEGGKPQFLVYIQSKMSFFEHNTAFNSYIQSKNYSKNTAIIDGEHLIGIDSNHLLDEVGRTLLTNDNTITIGKKKYEVSASHLASVALCYQYLNNQSQK